MKNRTFQRLFPLLRMGSILLAAVLGILFWGV